MTQLQQLQASIRLLEDLQGVVRTMKAMARVAVRRYESARESLQGYAGNVELALHAFLQDQRFQERAERPQLLSAASSPAPRRVGLVLFGSDQGPCGSFNERVLARHRQLLEDLALVRCCVRQAVVGRRLGALLAAGGVDVDRHFTLTHALDGTTRLIQELLLVHHQEEGAARGTPVVTPLLPLVRSGCSGSGRGPGSRAPGRCWWGTPPTCSGASCGRSSRWRCTVPGSDRWRARTPPVWRPCMQPKATWRNGWHTCTRSSGGNARTPSPPSCSMWWPASRRCSRRADQPRYQRSRASTCPAGP